MTASGARRQDHVRRRGARALNRAPRRGDRARRGAESAWADREAAWLAVPPREELAIPHGARLRLRDALLAGASVTVCGQCAARRGLGPGDLVAPATIRGAAAYVEEILRPDVQAIVY